MKREITKQTKNKETNEIFLIFSFVFVIFRLFRVSLFTYAIVISWAR
jgi:hypothetical protein